MLESIDALKMQRFYIYYKEQCFDFDAFASVFGRWS